MRYFCTYFDSNYMVKGLALYRSLARHAGDFRLWVLALDDETAQTLTDLGLPGVQAIALAELEAADPGLAAVRPTRSRVEYYFTCTSALTLYVLDHWPQVDAITYLDADLYFFAGPAPIEEEFSHGSVLIVGHRFPPALRHLETRGVYNVGYVSFRRDDAGLACLRWWRARCLEWCYDRVEPGRFADQKYLDQWPGLFPGVIALRHLGGGLAPWNMANYRYTIGPAGDTLVDGQALVFVHFHGVKPVGRWLVDPGLDSRPHQGTEVLKYRIYGPYLREIWQASRWLAEKKGHPLSMRSLRGQVVYKPPRFGALSRWARLVRGQLETAVKVLRGERWLVFQGRVI